ncbi:hypothetical protein Pmani_008585 [Petrolisthes manimaculis]|uniref:Uncharacterized protein n=1 Tax=Petrolisthes manimaculis TaxID=1843537 RepID=A0AAE1Q621_9EUCA|nr:hypothetical protein Pmani_008585 [Petrolisthes manimaculis]
MEKEDKQQLILLEESPPSSNPSPKDNNTTTTTTGSSHSNKPPQRDRTSDQCFVLIPTSSPLSPTPHDHMHYFHLTFPHAPPKHIDPLFITHPPTSPRSPTPHDHMHYFHFISPLLQHFLTPLGPTFCHPPTHPHLLFHILHPTSSLHFSNTFKLHLAPLFVTHLPSLCHTPPATPMPRLTSGCGE